MQQYSHSKKNISHVSVYLDRIIRLKVKEERKKERARVFKDKEIWKKITNFMRESVK